MKLRGEALNGDLGSPFENRALEIGALALSSTWFQTYTGEAQELVKSGLAAGCRFPVGPAGCASRQLIARVRSPDENIGGGPDLVTDDPDCLTFCRAAIQLLLPGSDMEHRPPLGLLFLLHYTFGDFVSLDSEDVSVIIRTYSRSSAR